MRWLPRFRAAYRGLEMLRARENWSREQIQAFQLERLNLLWQHAAAYVPYYRGLKTDLNLPVRFCSLEEFTERMPMLSKSTVRNSNARFVSERADLGGWRYTGGSTGTPTGCFWGKKAHLEMLQAKYRFYDMWGVDIFDRMVFVWGHAALSSPGLAAYIARVRQPIEDGLRNRLRLSPYRLGTEELRAYLRRIERFRPVALYSYSTAAYLLAQEAENTGFRCESLKLVNLAAEPAYPHIVAAVERGFGVPAINEYGSSECGFVAGEWPDRTLRVREDIVLVETPPGDDGHHDIVLTILTNHSFPLIRYRIADFTDAPVERRERGFSILHNVAGRDNDLVRCRSGRLLHPVWFMAVLDKTKAVRRYQIYQRRDGHLSVRLELNHIQRPPDTDMLTRLFREQLEGYPVEMEIVPSIPQTAAGKHRWIVSELVAAEKTDLKL